MRRRRRRRRPKSCSEIAEKIKSPTTAPAAATAATTTKRLLPDWLTVNLLLVEKRQARGYCSFPTVGFGCHSTEWVAAAGSGSRQQQSASRDWSSLWGWFWRSLLRLGRVSHCVALRAGEREREWEAAELELERRASTQMSFIFSLFGTINLQQQQQQQL